MTLSMISQPNSDTYDALMRAVEQSPPEETTPLLVTADWCDENDMANFAYAFRWCAARGIRPFNRTHIKRYPWVWVREQKRYDVRSLTRLMVQQMRRAKLPQIVFDALPDCPDVRPMIEFNAHNAAYAYLAVGLAKIRQTVEVGELPPIVHKPLDVSLVVCRRCGMARCSKVEECPVCRRTDE